MKILQVIQCSLKNAPHLLLCHLMKIKKNLESCLNVVFAQKFSSLYMTYQTTYSINIKISRLFYIFDNEFVDTNFLISFFLSGKEFCQYSIQSNKKKIIRRIRKRE